MKSMRCDKRPRDEAVEMVNDPPKFMITDKTPPLLMAWWNYMHEFRRTEIFKHLGFLTDIMRFSPDRDLIEAFIPFWDSTSKVFRFSDFELTPTLEELGGFTGLGKDLRSKTLIAPRSVSGNKFLEQMHISHPHKECFENGMKELVDKLPKGVKAWRHYLLKLTASDITWNYHWFPASEIPLRVLRQLGQRQILPRAEDTQSFIGEMSSEDRDRESEAQKIWVPPSKVMPVGSARELRNREEKIEVRIKQARLEVERNNRSTMDILSNDLKNAREELAQRDAIFKERVRLIQKRAEKEHQSTIRTLHEDLGIVTGAMEQQEEEYKKEKTLLMHTHARLQNQLKASMGRETDIAKRFTSYQAKVAIERNQWMGEREELHNQIEELQAHEEDLTHMVDTTQEWLQNCHENMEEANGQVLQLTESLIDVYGGYLHRSDESLGRHARALAPQLPKALFKVYSSLGGNW
ncbi:hypothetical protein KY284_007852 [Solanum tuberosum]|nr:hypothetical protein KY284_007852 [Solanum tuberosum]